MQGRPGPVVVALPEDMLDDVASVADAPHVTAAEPAVSAADAQAVGAMIAQAERPMIIVGGSRWTPGAADALVAFATAHDLPVATAFRRAHLFPATDPHHAGDLGIGPNPVLAAAVRDADLLVPARRADVGDRVVRLYADRRTDPAPSAGPYPSRSDGTGPRLSARISDRGDAGHVPGCAGRPARRAAAPAHRGSPRVLPRLV